jgi:hypothetical protein
MPTKDHYDADALKSRPLPQSADDHRHVLAVIASLNSQ